MSGLDDAPLQAALDRLAEADILLVQGLPPDADYRFKHALIQDAAYENLLKSRRQILHRRIARRFAKGSPPALEPSLNWWLITLHRPVSPRMRLNGGVELDNDH